MTANRRLLVALAGVLAVVFAFVASNVAADHEPKPHELPVGLIASPPAAAAPAGRLERSAPGAFAVRTYGSGAAARTAILHGDVYGGFEPGRRPTLLVAAAAGPPPELVLRRTFGAVARGRGQPLAMRDVVYFHGRGATDGLLVLAVYAVAGATGALAATAAGIGAAGRTRYHHPTTPEIRHVTA